MNMKFTRASNTLEIDPLIRKLTRKQLQEEIAEYEALLDACVNEAKIHSFLASHSYFFNGILRMFGESPLYSKIKLGHDFEIDFAWFDTGSNGPEWNFAEIESPTRSMFTKSGDASAWLTHAIQQVLDWHSWIHDNAGYAKKLMLHVEYPLGFVFIGRRKDLTPFTRKRLKRLCYEHRTSLEIHTLDWFISAAQSVENLLDSRKGGRWTIPAKAFGHSELANGLPLSAKTWLESPFAQQTTKSNRKHRLQDRKYRYLSNEDLVD